MQEESIITIIMFLIAQTIAIYQKLSRIEEKINEIKKHNDRQDIEIAKIEKVIAHKVEGAAKDLIP